MVYFVQYSEPAQCANTMLTLTETHPCSEGYVMATNSLQSDQPFVKAPIQLSPSNHRQSERKLIEFVKDGYLEIDASGCVWRNGIRRGKKSGGSHVVDCLRRPAEKRLPSGYIMVRAQIDGVRIVGLAHRLVWQHFYGDIPDGMVINHKNGVKDDNRPENLEVVSYSENMKHAYRVGLIDEHGENNPAATLADNQVGRIRAAYASGDFTMTELAERFCVSVQHISRLVKGKRRRKQAGPIVSGDQRHNSCRRGTDGRFLPCNMPSR